jgi:hypothetical protein
MRQAHELADEHDDVATASALQLFVDEAEKRSSRGTHRGGD